MHTSTAILYIHLYYWCKCIFYRYIICKRSFEDVTCLGINSYFKPGYFSDIFGIFKYFLEVGLLAIIMSYRWWVSSNKMSFTVSAAYNVVHVGWYSFFYNYECELWVAYVQLSQRYLILSSFSKHLPSFTYDQFTLATLICAVCRALLPFILIFNSVV